jgi:hypothetical protein
VRLGVRAQAQASLVGESRHGGQIARHRVEIDDERRRVDGGRGTQGLAGACKLALGVMDSTLWEIGSESSASLCRAGGLQGAEGQVKSDSITPANSLGIADLAGQPEAGGMQIVGWVAAYHATCQSRSAFSMLPTRPG